MGLDDDWVETAIDVITDTLAGTHGGEVTGAFRTGAENASVVIADQLLYEQHAGLHAEALRVLAESERERLSGYYIASQGLAVAARESLVAAATLGVLQGAGLAAQAGLRGVMATNAGRGVAAGSMLRVATAGTMTTEAAINFGAASRIAVGFAELAGVSLRGGGRLADQYALVAREDGYYPVMKRGFADPVDEVFLRKGDVWKYGKTVNPDTRYSKQWLEDHDLIYKPDFRGTEQEALAREYQQLVGYKARCGSLPPGNKVTR